MDKKIVDNYENTITLSSVGLNVKNYYYVDSYIKVLNDNHVNKSLGEEIVREDDKVYLYQNKPQLNGFGKYDITIFAIDEITHVRDNFMKEK